MLRVLKNLALQQEDDVEMADVDDDDGEEEEEEEADEVEEDDDEAGGSKKKRGKGKAKAKGKGKGKGKKTVSAKRLAKAKYDQRDKELERKILEKYDQLYVERGIDPGVEPEFQQGNNHRPLVVAQVRALVASIRRYGLQNFFIIFGIPVEVKPTELDTDALTTGDNPDDLGEYRNDPNTKDVLPDKLRAFGGQHRYYACVLLRHDIKRDIMKWEDEIAELTADAAKADCTEEAKAVMKERIAELEQTIKDNELLFIQSLYWRLIFYNKDELSHNEGAKDYLGTNQQLHVYPETLEEALEKAFQPLLDAHAAKNPVAIAEQDFALSKVKGGRATKIYSSTACREVVRTMLESNVYFRHMRLFKATTLAQHFHTSWGELLSLLVRRGIKDLECMMDPKQAMSPIAVELEEEIAKYNKLRDNMIKLWTHKSAPRNDAKVIDKYGKLVKALAAVEATITRMKNEVRGENRRDLLRKDLLLLIDHHAKANLKKCAWLFGKPELLEDEDFVAGGDAGHFDFHLSHPTHIQG
ncbi:hypothetical protein BDN72DRAFT_907111 [Pluteus cervinus]|uniref:Uncharacterized protein n=1 Tax=Pluteus cervinus TaxID=181527 RepID=A0ACD2ZXF5_9AGAR|nr:hypothetical protein BDN72DRAFT_907111 [Pluteus cervinus]